MRPVCGDGAVYFAKPHIARVQIRIAGRWKVPTIIKYVFSKHRNRLTQDTHTYLAAVDYSRRAIVIRYVGFFGLPV